MNPLNHRELLLSALQYPLFAMPDYLLQKQRESGWSKAVFLQLLTLSVEELQQEVRSNNPPPLGALTGGKVMEARTFSGEMRSVLDQDILSTLRYAVNKAYELEEPSPAYTALQIVSFLEVGLEFIQTEFEVQAQIKKDPFRAVLLGYRAEGNEGQPVFQLNRYSLKVPSPVFDFQLLKNAVRHLLLSSARPDKLEAILRPCFEKCRRIVVLWNEEINPLEERNDNTVQWQHRLLSFSTDELNFSLWEPSSFAQFAYGEVKGYWNRDLALFAYNTGNFLAEEVLNETKPLPKANEESSSKLKHLLRLYYQKGCKALNKQQVEKLAEDVKMGKAAMKNRWDALKRDGYRHNGNVNNANEFVRVYEALLVEFRHSNEQAYKDVLNHYNQLKHTYPDLVG